MRPGLTIIVLLVWTLNSYCQTTSDKAEILNEFQKTRSIPNIDSVFYDGYHFGARKNLDALLSEKIDTLVVYSFDHPGHRLLTKSDSCKQIRNAYFFWQKDGAYFFRSNNDHCLSIDKIDNSKVLNFAVNNFPKIKDEFFMGAIFETEKQGDKIKITESWIDHEGKYSILVLVNGQYNYLEFTDNALTNKKSWFLDYNKALTSFTLFELIKGEIKTGG